MIRAFIFLVAAIFALYGGAFIVSPYAVFAAVTDTVLPGSSGAIEARAAMGGMCLAVGLVLFLLGARERTQVLGLQAVAIFMLAMAVGRAVGLLLDGDANNNMVIYFVLEVLTAFLAILGLKYKKRQRAS